MNYTSLAFKDALKRNDYEIMADLFLQDTNVTMKIEYLKTGKHFPRDESCRDIYTITLTKGNRKWSFNFGRSILHSTQYKDNRTGEIVYLDGSMSKGGRKVLKECFNDYVKAHCKKIKGEEPTYYDVLACLTKYDVGSFENFCADFGYDEDSRSAEKIYHAVCDEWLNVQRFWNDKQIEALQEIS